MAARRAAHADVSLLERDAHPAAIQPAALTFGLAGWRLADRRPWLAGLFLGLAMMKPQVALPYCVWAVLTGRWRVVPTAVLTVAALWQTYCLRVGAAPLTVFAAYVRTLRGMYSGPDQQVGVSELARLAPDGAADVWTIATALALCALLAWTVVRQWRRGRVNGQVGRGDPPDMRGLPGTMAAAVLVTLRHLSYAFVSLLPASAFLLLDDNAGPWRGRRLLFWSLQLGLIVDVPMWYRLVQRWGWSAGRAEGMFIHFDRGFMLAAVATLIVLQWRPGAIATEPARATP